MRYDVSLNGLTEKEKERVCSILKKCKLPFTTTKIPRSIEDIFNEIRKRYTADNSRSTNFYFDRNTKVCVWLGVKNTVPIVGISRCNFSDEFSWKIGYHLSLCRAHGWKDLEEELLDAIE